MRKDFTYKQKSGDSEQLGKLLAISDKELEMLEALAKYRNAKAAAEKLGLKQSTARNRIARLKWRYHLAKDFVREVERWNAKLPTALEE
jgi:DNA-binding MarR family transcriptional regulator